MVELKARFDERANIRWAKKLEEAGVHVVYGIPALKTHAKCILVVRREGDGRPPLRPHRDRQLQPEDGAHLHRPRAVHRRPGDRRRHRRDVQLPDRLRAAAAATARSSSPRSTSRRGSSSEIERTIESHSPERPARIRMKMNSLLDAPSIRALYRASQAGVEVELNVRGICALRPGVPGVSENIQVVSVVGRFLEHSRIYSLRAARRDRSASTSGSADLMPRNLYNRVELVTPVAGRRIRARAARRARPLPRRQHERLGPRRGRRLAPPPPERRAAQRPARADRAGTRPEPQSRPSEPRGASGSDGAAAPLAAHASHCNRWRSRHDAWAGGSRRRASRAAAAARRGRRCRRRRRRRRLHRHVDRLVRLASSSPRRGSSFSRPTAAGPGRAGATAASSTRCGSAFRLASRIASARPRPSSSLAQATTPSRGSALGARRRGSMPGTAAGDTCRFRPRRFMTGPGARDARRAPSLASRAPASLRARPRCASAAPRRCSGPAPSTRRPRPSSPLASPLA